MSAWDAENARIEFINSGAFNKLYKIACSASEAATLDVVSVRRSVPVPHVIAKDISYDNEIGFEWILMEFVPGTTLEDVWKVITWSAKCALIERVADVTTDLSRIQCKRIGNIYRSTELPEFPPPSAKEGLPPGYTLGRIVSMAFFWENHLALDIPRGPFASSIAWLSAILAHKKHDNDRAILATQALESSGSHADDKQENIMTRILIERLLDIMPKIFPPSHTANESFVLRHDDMHQKNIMVDALRELTALVDWECVSVVPMWKACQLPSLLEGRERSDEPQLEAYSRNDDGTLDEGYYEHVQEYELTRLRQLFFERMEIVELRWMVEFRASELKADFGWAAENCDTEFCRTRIGNWLDNMMAGLEQPDLRYTMTQE